jgi:hypothetical protein
VSVSMYVAKMPPMVAGLGASCNGAATGSGCFLTLPPVRMNAFASASGA